MCIRAVKKQMRCGSSSVGENILCVWNICKKTFDLSSSLSESDKCRTFICTRILSFKLQWKLHGSVSYTNLYSLYSLRIGMFVNLRNILPKKHVFVWAQWPSIKEKLVFASEKICFGIDWYHYSDETQNVVLVKTDGTHIPFSCIKNSKWSIQFELLKFLQKSCSAHIHHLHGNHIFRLHYSDVGTQSSI